MKTGLLSTEHWAVVMAGVALYKAVLSIEHTGIQLAAFIGIPAMVVTYVICRTILKLKK